MQFREIATKYGSWRAGLGFRLCSRNVLWAAEKTADRNFSPRIRMAKYRYWNSMMGAASQNRMPSLLPAGRHASDACRQMGPSPGPAMDVLPSNMSESYVAVARRWLSYEPKKALATKRHLVPEWRAKGNAAFSVMQSHRPSIFGSPESATPSPISRSMVIPIAPVKAGSICHAMERSANGWNAWPVSPVIFP
jgi:hypothetical protein